MEQLAEREVGGNVVWLEFERVLEVLGSLLSFARVGEDCGKVDTRPKVFVVDAEALLKERDRAFVLFLLLVDYAKVKECIGIRTCKLRGTLVLHHRVLCSSFLLEHATKR